jgi:hypothetical protein
MRVMAVVARRIARDRQEGDPLLRDFDPGLFAGQKFERAALLAIDRRGAIVAAATELAIAAVDAGIDSCGSAGVAAIASTSAMRSRRIIADVPS